MDQATPPGAHRWRGSCGWKRLLLAVCLLPPFAFALSNLWLVTPHARGWIAAKIQRRCGGLTTHVGSASWSPWNGITLRNIVVAQPAELNETIAEPLLHIDSLRVTPVWASCLRGHMAVRAADIEAPSIVVSARMLSSLAQHAAPPATPLPAVEPAIPLAAVEPAIPPVAALHASREAQPNPPVDEPTAAAPPPPRPAPPAPKAETALPTAWLRLRHASFRLVSSGTELPLVEIADLSGDLPVAGAAAASRLSLASLKSCGLTLLSDFHAPLAWQYPVLALKPVEATVEGIRFQFAGKLALLPGLPLQIEVQVPEQSPAPLALPDGGAINAAQFASNARFRGWLLAPGSWQGDWLGGCAAIAIQAGEHQAAFDRGSCVVALRGGVLSCVDARLVGENLSLLGNATVLADGRAAGVLRLVAPPETTVGIIQRFFPDHDPTAALTPLSTPQRTACDLEVFGTLNNLQIRIGQNGPVMPLP